MRADGFTCFEASNGIDALAQLAVTDMMLVLSDLRMPKMGGIELLRELRILYPDIAVVMITAVADVEVAVNCLSLGASDYVPRVSVSRHDCLNAFAQADTPPASYQGVE